PSSGETADVGTRTPAVPVDPKWKTRWSIETHQGSTGDLEYSKDEPGRLRVTLTRLTGHVPWYVKLQESSFRTVADHKYVLTFRARADAARQFGLAMGRNGPPWNGVGLYRTVDVTTEWQTFQYPFVSTSTESNARISFDLAGAGAAVELANVALRDMFTGEY